MLVFLKDLLRTLYAPHFLYASEVDCKELNVEQELELEKPQLSYLVAECKQILTNVGKLLASYAAKIDPNPDSLVFVSVLKIGFIIRAFRH